MAKTATAPQFQCAFPGCGKPVKGHATFDNIDVQHCRKHADWAGHLVRLESASRLIHSMTRHKGSISTEERAAGNADGNKLTNLGACVYDHDDVIRTALSVMLDLERKQVEAIEAFERLNNPDQFSTAGQRAEDLVKLSHLPEGHAMPAQFVDHNALIKTAMGGVDDALFVAAAAVRNVQQAVEASKSALENIVGTVAHKTFDHRSQDDDVRALLAQILDEPIEDYEVIPDRIIDAARAMRKKITK